MKTIVIRGCVFRVTDKQAKELQEQERKEIQKEWAKNRLID